MCLLKAFGGFYLKALNRELGDGTNTNILIDPLVPNPNFKVFSPNLSTGFDKVDDPIDLRNMSWNVQMVRQLY